MKALDVSDLQTILDGDLVWRRREISSLVTLAKSSSVHVQGSLIRATIPMLYAHWEGFGRECFLRYLEFVSYKRVKFKLLNPAFLYLASMPSLERIGTVGVKEALEIIQTLIHRSDVTNKDNFRKRISTKSNLRGDILKDLLLSCGLEADLAETNHDFINRELCDPRNEIAHGGGSAPSLDAFLKRREKAFEIMSALQTIIVNAAANKDYHLPSRAA